MISIFADVYDYSFIKEVPIQQEARFSKLENLTEQLNSIFWGGER